MESQRQKKVAKQLQKDLSDIFQHELSHILEGAFVTVTVVKISPDLGIAKIYLSAMLEKNKQMLMFRIKENTKQIRYLLGQRIKNQVRIIPELNFYFDDTEEEVSKINQLFVGLEIPPADKDYNLPVTEEDE